jgi:hypothetical protein
VSGTCAWAFCFFCKTTPCKVGSAADCGAIVPHGRPASVSAPRWRRRDTKQDSERGQPIGVATALVSAGCYALKGLFGQFLQIIGSGDIVRGCLPGSRSTAAPLRAIGCRLAKSGHSPSISRIHAKRLRIPAGLTQSHIDRWSPRHARSLFGAVVSGHHHHKTRPPSANSRRTAVSFRHWVRPETTAERLPSGGPKRRHFSDCEPLETPAAHEPSADPISRLAALGGILDRKAAVGFAPHPQAGSDRVWVEPSRLARLSRSALECGSAAEGAQRSQWLPAVAAMLGR